MIQHVEYEVIMLLGSAAELDNGERERDDIRDLAVDNPERIARTAFLEVFLLHARALDEFLGPRRSRDDDLWATDYVTSWPDRWAARWGARDSGPLDKPDRDRINKQLAHVTTKRIDKEEFPLASIAVDIRTGLSLFAHDAAVRNKPEFDRL